MYGWTSERKNQFIWYYCETKKALETPSIGFPKVSERNVQDNVGTGVPLAGMLIHVRI